MSCPGVMRFKYPMEVKEVLVISDLPLKSRSFFFALNFYIFEAD